MPYLVSWSRAVCSVLLHTDRCLSGWRMAAWWNLCTHRSSSSWPRCGELKMRTSSEAEAVSCASGIFQADGIGSGGHRGGKKTLGAFPVSGTEDVKLPKHTQSPGMSQHKDVWNQCDGALVAAHPARLVLCLSPWDSPFEAVPLWLT